eukprot:m.4624 g.4624  ORF g.4624 m.4624 type:complete len:390 (+) comp11028_c0_seq1:315-1484(+)
MGKSQSKSKTPKKRQSRDGRSPRGDVPDSPYVNPDEETAEASFDKPARVRMLTTATKDRARTGPQRRPPTRKAIQKSLKRSDENESGGNNANGDAPREIKMETPPDEVLVSVKNPVTKRNNDRSEAAAAAKTGSLVLRLPDADSSPTAGRRKDKSKSPDSGSLTPSSRKIPFVPNSSDSPRLSPGLPRLFLKSDIDSGHSPGSTRRELFHKNKSKSVPSEPAAEPKKGKPVSRAKSLHSPPPEPDSPTAQAGLKTSRSSTGPSRKLSPSSNGGSTGASPGKLPRFAFDAASVDKQLTDKKKRKINKSDDVKSETKKEKTKQKRRSSFESDLLPSSTNYDGSRRTSDPQKRRTGLSTPVATKVGFLTPQMTRKSEMVLTPKLGRPQIKVN